MTLFEDLKNGLEEANAYVKGNGPAKKRIYDILPVQQYERDDIKRIRAYCKMSQMVFATYMGVSIKTVEAWENGRNNPTGPANRLLYLLEQSDSEHIPFLVG